MFLLIPIGQDWLKQDPGILPMDAPHEEPDAAAPHERSPFVFVKALPRLAAPAAGWTLKAEVEDLLEMPNPEPLPATRTKVEKVQVKGPDLQYLCGVKHPLVRVYCQAHPQCSVQWRIHAAPQDVVRQQEGCANFESSSGLLLGPTFIKLLLSVSSVGSVASLVN